MSKTVEQLEAELAVAPDSETMMAIWAEIYARQRTKPRTEDDAVGGTA